MKRHKKNKDRKWTEIRVNDKIRDNPRKSAAKKGGSNDKKTFAF